MKEVSRSCDYCCYENLNENSNPCNNCIAFSNFTPRKNIKKAELLELLEEKERDIKNLHEQIDKLEKYAKYDEYADEIKAMYDGFVNAGFSESQAFILLTTIVENTLRKPSSFR